MSHHELRYLIRWLADSSTYISCWMCHPNTMLFVERSISISRSIFWLSWETKGALHIKDHPSKIRMVPQLAVAGVGISKFSDVTGKGIYAFLSFSLTQVLQLLHVIMPSTLTPPTFTLQLFLDSPFSKYIFRCFWFYFPYFVENDFFQIDIFHSGPNGQISSQPVWNISHHELGDLLRRFADPSTHIPSWICHPNTMLFVERSISMSQTQYFTSRTLRSFVMTWWPIYISRTQYVASQIYVVFRWLARPSTSITNSSFI